MMIIAIPIIMFIVFIIVVITNTIVICLPQGAYNPSLVEKYQENIKIIWLQLVNVLKKCLVSHAAGYMRGTVTFKMKSSRLFRKPSQMPSKIGLRVTICQCENMVFLFIT